MSRPDELRQEAGQPQHVFHVFGPQGALADITQVDATSPRVVSYLVNDRLGSVGAVFNDAGVLTQRLFFEPFGRRVNADSTPFKEQRGRGELIYRTRA